MEKQFVEFEEKTVEKAIELACKHYNCTESELEYEIVTKGSTGLFGLGGRKAKIRAKCLKEIDAVEEKALPEEAVEPQKPKIEEQPTLFEETEDNAQSVSVEKDQDIYEEDREETLRIAKEIADNLLEKAGFEGEVVIQTNEDGPFLEIIGPDLSLIIGKEGDTLNALEYIVNRILSKKMPECRRVAIDAGGYREKRSRNLRLLAQRIANKAKRLGKDLALNPMGARDRRTVHIALKNFPGIKTRSIGEGLRRKVLIVPLRKNRRGPRRRKNNYRSRSGNRSSQG